MSNIKNSKIVGSLGDTVVRDEELMEILIGFSSIKDLLLIVVTYLSPQVDFAFCYTKSNTTHLKNELYILLFNETDQNKIHQNKMDINQTTLIKLLDSNPNLFSLAINTVMMQNNLFIIDDNDNKFVCSNKDSIFMKKYDIKNNSWKEISQVNFNMFYKSSIVEYDDLIYMFGGYNNNHSDYNSVNYCQMYNSKTDDWRILPDMKYNRDSHSAIVNKKNKKIYVFGGIDDKSCDSCEIFDIKTEKWEKSIKMPFKVYDHSNIIIEDKIYIMGGFENEEDIVTSDIYCYDTRNNSCIKMNWSLPIPMYKFLPYLAKNGDLILFGGKNKNGKNL